jgi:hypothetical protein
MRWTTKVMLLIVVMQQCIPAVLARHCALPQDKGNTVRGIDEVGPIVIGNGTDRSKKESEVRNYLRTHWRERRLGRLIAIWTSKEGRTSKTAYVIEKDEHGVWTLSVTTQWPQTEGSGPKHDPVKYRVYAVRRIEPRHDGQAPAIFVSDDERRSGDTYRLIFYDEQGNETGGV